MLVIGVGSCGCEILEEHIDGCRFLAVLRYDDADKSSAETLRARNPNQIMRVLPPYLENISEVIIVVGLGGRFGTDAAPIATKAALEKGLSVQVIATLPFDFEGPSREYRAGKALEALKGMAPVIVFDNEALIGQGHADMEAAYAHVHEQTKNIIEAAIKTTPSTAIH